jgi:hypothetical protein
LQASAWATHKPTQADACVATCASFAPVSVRCSSDVRRVPSRRLAAGAPAATHALARRAACTHTRNTAQHHSTPPACLTPPSLTRPTRAHTLTLLPPGCLAQLKRFIAEEVEAGLYPGVTVTQCAPPHICTHPAPLLGRAHAPHPCLCARRTRGARSACCGRAPAPRRVCARRGAHAHAHSRAFPPAPKADPNTRLSHAHARSFMPLPLSLRPRRAQPSGSRAHAGAVHVSRR